MNQRTKIILWLSITLLLAAVLYLNRTALKALFKGKATAKPLVPAVIAKNVTVGSPSAGGGYTGYTAGNLDACLSMSAGSSGAEVKELQTILNQWDSSNNLTVDGIFGDATTAALQSSYGTYYITLNQAWNFYTDAIIPALQHITCSTAAKSGGGSNNSSGIVPGFMTGFTGNPYYNADPTGLTTYYN